MTPVFISRCGIKLEHFYRQTSMGIDIEYKQPFITLVDRILAITKDDDYLQNTAKREQVKELEKQIDPVRCSCAVRRLPSNGILSNGASSTTSRRRRLRLWKEGVIMEIKHGRLRISN